MEKKKLSQEEIDGLLEEQGIKTIDLEISIKVLGFLLIALFLASLGIYVLYEAGAAFIELMEKL